MVHENAATGGHRVTALIYLDEAESARLLNGVFRPGSRSVLFSFPEIVGQSAGSMLGAIIESIDAGVEGQLRVALWFWDEIARIHATPGVGFEVWYGRTVGSGEVSPM